MRIDTQLGVRVVLTLFAKVFFSGWKALPRLAPVIALVLGVILGVSTSEHFKVSFYAVTAQIIPVFLLTLSFEVRAFEIPHLKAIWADYSRRIDEGDLLSDGTIDAAMEINIWIMLFFVLAALVVGEAVSVTSVAYGHPLEWTADQGIVLGACLAGVVMIGYAAIAGPASGVGPASDTALSPVPQSLAQPHTNGPARIPESAWQALADLDGDALTSGGLFSWNAESGKWLRVDA